jgi:hypothetical protein
MLDSKNSCTCNYKFDMNGLLGISFEDLRIFRKDCFYLGKFLEVWRGGGWTKWYGD